MNELHIIQISINLRFSSWTFYGVDKLRQMLKRKIRQSALELEVFPLTANMCKVCLINEPSGTLFEWNTTKWWRCLQFIPHWQHFLSRSWTEAQPCPILTSDWPCQTSLFRRSFWWSGGKSSQPCSVLSCGNELAPEGNSTKRSHTVPLKTRIYTHPRKFLRLQQSTSSYYLECS